jgi:hypothetical protein
MIGFGCAISFCLFGALVAGGALVASRRAVSGWVGAGAGLTAWLAVMLGYGAVLTIRDWWVGKQVPPEGRVSRWGIAAIWGLFLLFSAAAALLYRQLYL